MFLIAHADAAVTPHDVWRAWTLEPSLTLPLVALVLVYAYSVRQLWRSGGRGAGISEGQVKTFAAAIVVLVIALVSPLDAVADATFAAHMVQHLLLVAVAAPLLLMGRVHLALIPVLPLSWRRRGARKLARGMRRAGVGLVIAAVALHIVTLLIWHLPPLYDAAVRHEPIHIVEHLTLLVGALPFWASMGSARPRPVATAALGAFATMLFMFMLAATMTAATHPWYTSHLATTQAWGLTPLQDQHLAAAIMWVPGGLGYLGASAVAVFRWIRSDERRGAATRVARPPIG